MIMNKAHRGRRKEKRAAADVYKMVDQLPIECSFLIERSVQHGARNSLGPVHYRSVDHPVCSTATPYLLQVTGRCNQVRTMIWSCLIPFLYCSAGGPSMIDLHATNHPLQHGQNTSMRLAKLIRRIMVSSKMEVGVDGWQPTRAAT